jgi:hydroxyethylthiazole kinase-like uncharacterized protein yjeF
MNQHIPSLTHKLVMTGFPLRPRDSHKGMFGTVAIIGGATGMVGAALLAGRAALKLGTGCVHVGLLTENAPVVDPLQPELMLRPAADTLHLPGIKVFVVGCGLGCEPTAQKLLYDALRSDIALVLDADALNILALRPDLCDDLRQRKAATVLTPHPAEAARLLDCTTAEVQADRVAATRQLAQRFAATVALKGADSLCATRDGRLFVNHTGNPGMSAPGMGDVLAGMVAALIAQGMNADAALLLAVHLHGAAGDALAEQKAAIGMTATEVTEWARWLLNQWVS